MAFKFEKLKIWQDALQLSSEIDTLVKTFPKNEMYSLCSQMKRAADSVVLNIAEGSTGQTTPVFTNFLNYALRSAIEVVACLFIARDRKYIHQDIFQKLYAAYETLCKMIPSFRDKL
jgi:four helix bundle protein